jgi:hypothetical protein
VEALCQAGATFTVLGTITEKYLPSHSFWQEFFAAVTSSLK